MNHPFCVSARWKALAQAVGEVLSVREENTMTLQLQVDSSLWCIFSPEFI